MDEKKSYFENLMLKYFLGEASSGEVNQLNTWLAEDPLNRSVFSEYHKTWMLLTKDAVSSTDVNKEWDVLFSRIENANTEGRKVVTGWSEKTSSPKIRRGGRSKIISMISSWRVAASLIVIVLMAAILYYLIAVPGMTEVYAEETNIEHVLPDGSVITLYKGSKIAYPASYIKDVRRVTLEGEANFNVQHDEKHPFVVSGSNLRILVLGTEFNVNTMAGDGKINVVLKTGTVSLFFKGKEADNMVLKPGETALIDIDEKTMLKSVNSDPNYNAWLTGNIVFNSATMDEVAQILEKVYHLDIDINENLKNCELTATFEKQSFEQVINVISETLGIKVKHIKDNVIYLDGNCQ